MIILLYDHIVLQSCRPFSYVIITIILSYDLVVWSILGCDHVVAGSHIAVMITLLMFNTLRDAEGNGKLKEEGGGRRRTVEGGREWVRHVRD